MTIPSVLLLRISAAVLILLLMAVIVLTIRRRYGAMKGIGEGHPKYQASTLDEGAPLPDNGLTAFEANGVEMHKTSRLNPGFFGIGKSAESAPPLLAPPELIIPLTIMAPNGRPFTGKNVRQLVQNFGLQYSPNQTFELLTAGGKEVFCTLLDVRRPGTLPQEQLDAADSTYEGIMLALQLPISQEPVQDWETFIALAHEMSDSCNGRLSDHRRRALNEHDLARYRKNIEQYEREYHNWLRRQQRV